MKKNFEAEYAVPDRRYGVYQIIHSGIVNPSLPDYYEKRGFAGVVGNLPYTEDFPRSEKAWEDFRIGAEAFHERGMRTWIYDESGYPSGAAGGYLTEYFPEYRAMGLYCFLYGRVLSGPRRFRSDVPGDRLWKAVLVPLTGTDEPVDVTDTLNERGVLYFNIPKGNFRLLILSVRRLFDGTHCTENYNEPRDYISLSDKKAVEAFLSCTYENYKKQVGDRFGKEIPAIFTDEPSLVSWSIPAAAFPVLPWLDSYPGDFEEKYGYSFLLACAATVTGMGCEVIKRRCDYWEFIADTVADAYFGTISAWCRENGIKFTGHLLEEERLQAHIINYGSYFRSMRKLDWPGIDQLNTEPSSLMNRNVCPIARLAASFGDLNGEHEVFTEFSDHSVSERHEIAGPSCYYASVNWHLAMGVNNFTSYYSWRGMTAEETLRFNLYTARMGTLLREGKRDSRAAVFYPEAAMWAAYTPSGAYRAIDSSPAMMHIENSFNRVSWELLGQQIDFDYTDREILLAGEIVGDTLCCRDRCYHAVALPCPRVLEDDLAEKLLAMAKAGIRLFFCGELPAVSRTTGEDTPILAALRQYAAARDGVFLAPMEDFGSLLDRDLPLSCRSLRLTEHNADILSHVRVTREGETVLFLTNMGEAAADLRFTVYGDFRRVLSADAHTGTISPYPYERIGNGILVHAGIGAADSFALILS